MLVSKHSTHKSVSIFGDVFVSKTVTVTVTCYGCVNILNFSILKIGTLNKLELSVMPPGGPH